MFQTRRELKDTIQQLESENRRLNDLLITVKRAELSGCESILCNTCEHAAYYEIDGRKRIAECDLTVACGNSCAVSSIPIKSLISL